MAHPQLGYALFQALLLNNIVDPAILQVSTYVWRTIHSLTCAIAYAQRNKRRGGFTA